LTMRYFSPLMGHSPKSSATMPGPSQRKKTFRALGHQGSLAVKD
jgi:hypothetical protein